jgi:hypothetical protein
MGKDRGANFGFGRRMLEIKPPFTTSGLCGADLRSGNMELILDNFAGFRINFSSL